MRLLFIEIRFKTQLPGLCSLLRSKVFPDSPFSDTDTVTASRSPSPELLDPQPDTRKPSPGPSTSVPTSKSDSRSLTRARSRSLSVSLAQEREERERSASIGPGKKRLLNREVSMSRAFKPRPKGVSKTVEPAPDPQAKTNGKLKLEKTEVILVEDTPQKPRVTSRKGSQPQFDVGPSSTNLFGVRQSTQSLFSNCTNETDDDDAWMLDSSPDVLLLHPGRKSGGGSDDEYEAVTFHTPSKKPRRRE